MESESKGGGKADTSLSSALVWPAQNIPGPGQMIIVQLIAENRLNNVFLLKRGFTEGTSLHGTTNREILRDAP